MTNEMTFKRPYEAPRLTIVSFKMEQGYAISKVGMFKLGDFYCDNGNDAWDGSTTGGNQFGGGWVDNGGSAWD